MRLESFEINNYRSIAQLEINPCGDFNVLIGRNNSGKSNILASIEVFFSALRPEVINTSPPIGQEIDFFQRDLKNNIQLRATFSPSEAEMQQLLDEIAIERPQVKKLLEEIGSDALLVVTTVFTPPPKKFAFVQSVVLLTEDGPRTIIEIDEAVAAELHGNVAGMERRIAANQALNRAVNPPYETSCSRSTSASPISPRRSPRQKPPPHLS
ncbi:AAA family ATPase [Bradyrhizobium genomosp. I (2014)]|uniref:AAA family ATPase n=1 Tax=Bradyrhizobium genomosp. I (2014) TaxID=2683269 RepID=UPI0009D91FFD|nr:AAA family ATPase [Bradyrhizobium sp. CCBAU 43298]